MAVMSNCRERGVKCVLGQFICIIGDNYDKKFFVHVPKNPPWFAKVMIKILNCLFYLSENSKVSKNDLL